MLRGGVSSATPSTNH